MERAVDESDLEAIQFLQLALQFLTACTTTICTASVPRDVNFALAMERSIVTFSRLTENLPEATFRRIYRMSPVSFYTLLSHIAPHIKMNNEMGALAKRPTVPEDVRLPVTLRLLAGARAGDMTQIFRIEQKTVYDIFHETFNALNEVLSLPGLPSDVTSLWKIADDFKQSRRRWNPLPVA